MQKVPSASLDQPLAGCLSCCAWDVKYSINILRGNPSPRSDHPLRWSVNWADVALTTTTARDGRYAAEVHPKDGEPIFPVLVLCWKKRVQ